ncbi:MAG: BON domain-containing protein [Pirellula sp.]|nr:BON domain-containing protein [Pirellula sp.]
MAKNSDHAWLIRIASWKPGQARSIGCFQGQGAAMNSNDQLQANVIAELKWDPTVHADNIEVTAKDGVVTLNGSVPMFAEKQAAEMAVQRVAGVKAIAEELEVNVTGAHKRSDEEIAHSIVESLKWHVWIPGYVQAIVENGWVTLNGEVTWGFQRHSAEEVVRYQAGVKGVSNHITLKSLVKSADVKELIEQALKRNAIIDSDQVTVTTKGGMVTLGGSVRSWDQRREAYSAAWKAPGVTGVENNLVVSY